MYITLIGMVIFRKKSLYVYTISFLLLATLIFAGLSLYSYADADDDKDDDHYGCDKDDESHGDDDRHDREERRHRDSRWDSRDFSSFNGKAKHNIIAAFFLITAVGSMFALGLYFFRSRK